MEYFLRVISSLKTHVHLYLKFAKYCWQFGSKVILKSKSRIIPKLLFSSIDFKHCIYNACTRVPDLILKYSIQMGLYQVWSWVWSSREIIMSDINKDFVCQLQPILSRHDSLGDLELPVTLNTVFWKIFINFCFKMPGKTLDYFFSN